MKRIKFKFSDVSVEFSHKALEMAIQPFEPILLPLLIKTLKEVIINNV